METQFVESQKTTFGGGEEIDSFSGLAKLYNHGNQPCLHNSWLFNYSGKPWLAQKWTRTICNEFYGQDFVIPTIDTRQLAERQLRREQVVLKENSLRLFELRDRYELPAYKAHNALSDALSTAELFLALVADLYPSLNCRLRDIVLKK